MLEQQRAAYLNHISTQVHVLEKANHGFGVRKRDGRAPGEVLDEAIRASTDWLHQAQWAEGGLA